MKRPELVTLFSPSERSLADTVHVLLRTLPDGDRGFTLRGHYARIEYDPQEDCYDFVDEQTNVVRGVDDLIARLERDRGGMWQCFVNFRFHASDVYVSHYYAQGDPLRLHTAVSTDSAVTRYLEDEAAGRGPYFALLGRLAEALGAEHFISGVRLDSLHPISAREVEDRAAFEATFGTSAHPYILGWREQSLDVAEIAASWGLDPADLVRTLGGHALLHRFPAPR